MRPFFSRTFTIHHHNVYYSNIVSDSIFKLLYYTKSLLFSLKIIFWNFFFSEPVKVHQAGLFDSDSCVVTRPLDVERDNTRVAGSISPVLLQSPLHLLKSNSGFGNCHLLQCSHAAHTSTHQLVKSVYAAAGEQWAEVPSAAISTQHGWIFFIFSLVFLKLFNFFFNKNITSTVIICVDIN